MRVLPVLILAGIGAGLGAARGGEPPLRVTSDTLEYCNELAARVHACASRRTEILELELQGRSMCRTGLVRGGIVRLRRAYLLLRASPEARSNCPSALAP